MPFMSASIGGSVKVVQLLLQHMGEQGVEETDAQGRTALHHAAVQNCEEMVAFLLSRGLQANSRDNTGMTPLMVATRWGTFEVMQMLVHRMGGQGLGEADTTGCTVLHHAAQVGRDEMVTFLLSKEVEASARDVHGMTPFMLAAAGGQPTHLKALQILLQHRGGQGLEEVDPKERTALHHAAQEGHEEVVTFLLSKGARADNRDNQGGTAIMQAAMMGHLGVVRVIAEHTGGRGLNEGDVYGWTALHLAANGAHDDVVLCLLLSGADPSVRDRQGRTPRDLALAVEEEEDEDDDEDRCWRAQRQETGENCVAVIDWWQGELERRQVLSRAACLHKACTMKQDKPTSRVPTYLEARAAGGHALPSVEVVSPQSQEQHEEKGGETEAGEKRKAAGEPGDQHEAETEEERHAMLKYVLQALNEELVIELLEGLH